jgi:hypothetical protein
MWCQISDYKARLDHLRHDYFNSLYWIDLVQQHLANGNNAKKIDILLYGDEGLSYTLNV